MGWFHQIAFILGRLAKPASAFPFGLGDRAVERAGSKDGASLHGAQAGAADLRSAQSSVSSAVFSTLRNRR
jgi:hypothetical protein